MFLHDKQMIDEIGRAAALLVSHVSIQIGSSLTAIRSDHLAGGPFDRNDIAAISGTGH